MSNPIGKVIAAASLLLCLPNLSAPAWAERVEEKDLVSGKAHIDPAKGYIFVHGRERSMAVFVKDPTEDERAVYQADWREAFEEAVEDYARELRSYEWSVDLYKQTRGRSRKPVKPVEPVEESFSIGDISLRMLEHFGKRDTYSRGDDYYSYLTEVEPGTYTYYGPVGEDGANVVGKCYCMGSVKFEVRAGEITNLGNLPMLPWVNAAERRRAGVEGMDEAPVASVDFGLPASLAALPSREADLRAAGKMNNFYRIRISRMPAIPGVLAYDRDRVIDLKAPPAASAEAKELQETARSSQRSEPAMPAGGGPVAGQAEPPAPGAAGDLPGKEPPEVLPPG